MQYFTLARQAKNAFQELLRRWSERSRSEPSPVPMPRRGTVGADHCKWAAVSDESCAHNTPRIVAAWVIATFLNRGYLKLETLTMETLYNAMAWLRLPVLASSGFAALASGLLYLKQNEIIYPRNVPAGSRTELLKPSQFGVTDYEELRIPTSDGETLSCLYMRPSNKSKARNVTVLMFHGNAGNIGHRIPIAKVLGEDLGYNVMMLEYRGYGLSTGTPDEEGLAIDAQTGLDYIRQRAETKSTKIVVYGQSLGGAVAIRLVARNQRDEDIAGLILENTFTSIRKLIPRYVRSKYRVYTRN